MQEIKFVWEIGHAKIRACVMYSGTGYLISIGLISLSAGVSNVLGQIGFIGIALSGCQYWEFDNYLWTVEKSQQ